jgi:hypothetical protein
MATPWTISLGTLKVISFPSSLPPFLPPSLPSFPSLAPPPTLPSFSQAGLSLPSAGITGVYHHARLHTSFLPRVMTLHKDMGYRSGCRWCLLRPAHPKARPHSSWERTRVLRMLIWKRRLIWRARMCGRLGPRRPGSVQSEVLSEGCEGSRGVTVRLAGVTAGKAGSWNILHGAERGLPAGSGAGSTFVNIKDTMSPKS